MICGFNPSPKFDVHTQALIIVRTISTIVITAKLVKLEDEVCQSTEEEEDGGNHSKFVLTASPEGCHEEDKNRHWNGSDC